MLLWILAWFAIFLLLALFATMAYIVAKGSRDERRQLLARSCPFCGYDLSRSPLWPNLARHDPNPKCPECGRVMTCMSGIGPPDNLPTLTRPDRDPAA